MLHHETDSPSEFTPEEPVSAVRAARDLPVVAVPPISVLDFDGDLTDWTAVVSVQPVQACLIGTLVHHAWW